MRNSQNSRDWFYRADLNVIINIGADNSVTSNRNPLSDFIRNI